MSSLYTSHHGSVIHVFFVYFSCFSDSRLYCILLMMFQWFMSFCICSWCFSDSCLFAYVHDVSVIHVNYEISVIHVFLHILHVASVIYVIIRLHFMMLYWLILSFHNVHNVSLNSCHTVFNVIHVKIIKVGSYNNRYLQQFGDIARLRTRVTCTHLYNLVSCYQLSHMTRVTLVVSK